MICQSTSHLDSAKRAFRGSARRVFLHPEKLNLIRFSTASNALFSRRITLAPSLLSFLEASSPSLQKHVNLRNIARSGIAQRLTFTETKTGVQLNVFGLISRPSADPKSSL